LGLENPGNFSRDSGIFFPNLRDFGIFSADFFEIFSFIFINEGHFHANSRFKCLNLMGFLNIAIILRILLGFFQVYYAIFRDFLGFGDSGI
jgi:hypothetical protein